MKKSWKNKVTMLAMTALVGTALLTGCAQQPETVSNTVDPTTTPSAIAQVSEEGQQVGRLLLSVNPEIAIGYDAKGNVLSLEGINEDGKKILSSYTEYEGVSCNQVIHDLVGAIDDAGYFESTIGGHEKNIILKLEPGSEYLEDDFLESLAVEVQQAVKERSIGSSAVAIGQDDYDDQFGTKGYINSQTAEEILQAQLGRDDIQFVEKEYEIDDGIYEIEFVLDGKEYEYEVNASTGKVLERDVDGSNDDWDDNDDRDDQNTPQPTTSKPVSNQNTNDDRDDRDDRDDGDDDRDDRDDRDDNDDDDDRDDD